MILLRIVYVIVCLYPHISTCSYADCFLALTHPADISLSFSLALLIRWCLRTCNAVLVKVRRVRISMTEKIKYFDRLMSKRDISKFDTTLLPSNDGGKYSPSIRRLVWSIFYLEIIDYFLFSVNIIFMIQNRLLIKSFYLR